MTLFADLKRLLHHISRRRRWQLLGLTGFMFLGAGAEMATIGAVVPFLALLANPALVNDYPVMIKVFGLLGWGGGAGVLVYASILFIIIAVSAAAVRIALMWVSLRLTNALGGDLTRELYRRTLYQPYSFHVSLNTSEILAGIGKTQQVVNSVIRPLIQSLIGLITVFAIMAVLFRIDHITASLAIFGFGLPYYLVSRIVRRKLSSNSKIISKDLTYRIKATQEGLGGIRDVLIDSTQAVYVKRFMKFDVRLRRAQTVNGFFMTFPRQFIEAIGMVLIASLAYWLSQKSGGLANAVPVLGSLALGAQKMMPQMQRIYSGWASIKGNQDILADVLSFLERPIPPEYLLTQRVDKQSMTHQITLHNLSFRYLDDAPEVIQGVSLDIPRGSRVGFIGKTGSGKSTLIDLIMGLLEPTAGHIEIDGQPLTSGNRRAWQAGLAHVPQAIFLSDSTIAENIAFGLKTEDIDLERVKSAAQKAQLDGFIESLQLQYQTVVGERGVRLSGGQRQRIGIARALYKQAEVLVLDEATSALDDATEKSFMQALETLGKEITVLMIAHRVTTLRNCDQIFELNEGKVVRRGIYKDLIAPELSSLIANTKFKA